MEIAVLGLMRQDLEFPATWRPRPSTELKQSQTQSFDMKTAEPNPNAKYQRQNHWALVIQCQHSGICKNVEKQIKM